MRLSSDGTPERTPAAVGHPQRQLILAVMCLCLILVVVNVASLNVALPSIIADLEPSATQILWIVDSYALVFAGLLLPAGAIGDRFGRRGALLVGLAIFGAFAVAASVSNGALVLIGARGVMGIGAALMMPATLSIIMAVFPPHERAKAIAIWAGLAGAGGALGVISAGVLLRWFEWGAIFLVNVPIAVLAFVLIVRFVPTSRDAEKRPLDPIGSVLSVAGLAILLFAIIEGPEKGWQSGAVLGGFGVSAALLVGFVAYELRSRHPMLDPRLFLIRRFGLSSLTITINFLAMFGFFLLITQYFQFVGGASPLEAGVRTLPFPIAIVLLSPRSPAIAARIGTRNAIAGGLLVQAAGFAVLATVGADTSYGFVVVGLLLLAVGMATLMAPATNAIVSSLPLNKAGVGSAVNDTTREVGGAIGIAVMGTLLTTGYQSTVKPVAESLPADAADAATDSIGAAFGVAGQLDPAAAGQLIAAARSGFADGMSIAFIFAAVLSVAGAATIRSMFPADSTTHETERGTGSPQTTKTQPTTNINPSQVSSDPN